MDQLKQFFNFVEASPTPYHCVRSAAALLDEAGFTALDAEADWTVVPGGKYYTTFQGLCLFTFTVGEDWRVGAGYHMAAAHGDAPCLRIKAAPNRKMGNYLFLNTEGYGGAILSSWTDRPLSIAGRVALRSADPLRPEMRLVDFGRPVALIPDVAPHLVQESSDSKQKRSVKLPLLTLDCREEMSGSYLENCLAKEMGVSAEDILDYELYLYHCAPCAVVGMEGDMVSGPRLDNLTSSYAVVRALADGARKHSVNVGVIFDAEEIGSRTKAGACSAATELLLKKLYFALGLTEAQCLSEMLRGTLLSCDVAHAFHPLFASSYDDRNACWPNRGICIKQAASQSYATDSAMGAMIRQLCDARGIPCQKFANHTDVRGGGTLANLVSCVLGVKAADIGVPLLAMHSAMETMGSKDEQHLVDLLTAFMSAE